VAPNELRPRTLVLSFRRWLDTSLRQDVGDRCATYLDFQSAKSISDFGVAPAKEMWSSTFPPLCEASKYVEFRCSRSYASRSRRATLHICFGRSSFPHCAVSAEGVDVRSALRREAAEGSHERSHNQAMAKKHRPASPHEPQKDM
jgi:hypothetical protein